VLKLKTIHGRETREARTERSIASTRLAVLEAVGHHLGFMKGCRTRGRKPEHMAESYPELQIIIAINQDSSKQVTGENKTTKNPLSTSCGFFV
jgi:hypothetical protein